MLVRSKALLMKKAQDIYYTLTVTSTNPVINQTTVTCVLNYDGQNHTATTATVLAGTVITYTLTDTTHKNNGANTVKTGTITMDSDITLNCTVSTSTTTEEKSWTQPTLSSNGTLGSGTMAVSASTRLSSSDEPFEIFDGTKSSSSCWQTQGAGRLNPSSSSYEPQTVTIYTQTPIKISKINFTNKYNNTAPYALKNFQIRGSSTNGNWTTIANLTNSTSTAQSTWTATVNSSNHYRYHQIYITGVFNYGNNYFAAICEAAITATYAEYKYTYYWNVQS